MKKIDYWGFTIMILLFLIGSVSGVASGAAQLVKSSVKGGQTPGAGLDRQQKWKTMLEAAKKEGSLTIEEHDLAFPFRLENIPIAFQLSIQQAHRQSADSTEYPPGRI